MFKVLNKKTIHASTNKIKLRGYYQPTGKYVIHNCTPQIRIRSKGFNRITPQQSIPNFCASWNMFFPTIITYYFDHDTYSFKPTLTSNYIRIWVRYRSELITKFGYRSASERRSLKRLTIPSIRPIMRNFKSRRNVRLIQQ